MEQMVLLAPAYEVRPSKRAKYAQIKITPAGKVLVVVPRRYDMRRIPAFVAEHQCWIDDKLHQLQVAHDPVYDSDRPQRIRLHAVDETWQVMYVHRPSTFMQSPMCLQISDGTPVKPQLLRWLTQRAKTAFSEQVETISRETGLLPDAIRIRGQKTRWGSCSSRRTLSLNRSLLFLPPPLVRYLIIHELCHLVHLNHSRNFWRLVQRFEPDYEQLDRDLSAASRFIPHWALPE